MHRLGAKELARYMERDAIGAWLAANSCAKDGFLTCQRWLLETPAKRYAIEWLYGDLLATQARCRVLDVGGGLTAITRALVARHDYTLIDLMAHDGPEAVAVFKASAPTCKIIVEDWTSALPDGQFDVVIAADLFPNVDQRLAVFLDRVLPRAREIRLSLTYYNTPRSYLVRRIDADEIMCMAAWDGPQTARTLVRFVERIDQPQFDAFEANHDSVYPNGRQVCFVKFRAASREA